MDGLALHRAPKGRIFNNLLILSFLIACILLGTNSIHTKNCIHIFVMAVYFEKEKAGRKANHLGWQLLGSPDLRRLQEGKLPIDSRPMQSIAQGVYELRDRDGDGWYRAIYYF